MRIPVENWGLLQSLSPKNRAFLVVFHCRKCLDHEPISASDDNQLLGFSIRLHEGVTGGFSGTLATPN